MTVGFSESALAAIEFPAALDLVAQHAVSPLGAARVRSLRPQADAWLVGHELERVDQYLARRDAGDDLSPEPFPDIAGPLARLRLEGSVLEGRELADVGVALAAARAVHARVSRVARLAPLVAALGVVPPARELEDALAAALEPDGLVRDAASRDLAQARRDVREIREDLVEAARGDPRIPRRPTRAARRLGHRPGRPLRHPGAPRGPVAAGRDRPRRVRHARHPVRRALRGHRARQPAARGRGRRDARSAARPAPADGTAPPRGGRGRGRVRDADRGRLLFGAGGLRRRGGGRAPRHRRARRGGLRPR